MSTRRIPAPGRASARSHGRRAPSRAARAAVRGLRAQLGHTASATKRAVKRTNTKAEIALRRALWAIGLRYRKNVASLPGRPDVVFTRARVVVFVDGDFWHGRDWEARTAKLERGANAPYRLAKIAANIERDRRKTAELDAADWTVVRLWETDVRRDPIDAARRLSTMIEGSTDRR